MSKMILSASGWRGIFAEGGDEESASPAISESHRKIAAAAAKVFSDYLSKKSDAAREQSAKGTLVVGRDTRPTGEAVADAVIRSLLAEGREVLYTGIVAAPEIMAYTRKAAEKDSSVLGFIYISASHNPIGHNGIKFGLTDGGVLQAGEVSALVSRFRSFLFSGGTAEKAGTLFNLPPGEKETNKSLAKVYAASKACKKAALSFYKTFSEDVISGGESACNAKSDRADIFSAIKTGLEKRPLGIAADFNGSARCVSIDHDFFSGLGINFYSINDKAGEIVHGIVPEGEYLEPCRDFVEQKHKTDSSLVLGYTPDCDGDRGNLVVWDDGKKQARILDAQEVFALACAAELASLVWTGDLKYDNSGKALSKTAIVVNDATSARVEKIAAAFDAAVFRAEVGEANVVGLARKLREEGYIVRILGEGSNGGIITHPSAVRDPVDTLGAIIKLLAIRRGRRGMGPFEIWCTRSNQSYSDDFTLADIIASLPVFVTTAAFDADAVLTVKTADHGLLKEKYEKIFMRDWREKRTLLKERFGITGWEAIAYNGIVERKGIPRFAEAGRGGLRIVFDGGKNACIWMRGSGTEPVFRVIADVEGCDTELERMLIEWQRRMVLEADNA